MQHILTKLFDHQNLSKEEATEVMMKMANGTYNEAQIAAFISVYLMRSIALDEILGFREALLFMALKVDLSDYQTIDIVGTGGDGKNTFNISTAACFVVAGAGYQVAKHGNYGATSVSGASNVLEFYGAKFTTDESVLKKSLEQAGFTYLHAPLFNPAMKHVAVARKNLGVRSFFNVLGPLINPSFPQYQCLGVYNLKMMRLYNYIYQQLGVQYTIVHNLDGYDELSLTDNAKVVNPTGEFVYSPEKLGFARIPQDALSGGNTVEDAAIIFLQVLENKANIAQKSVVIANAALAIQTLNPQKSLSDCVVEADEAIHNGKALLSFKKFIEIFQ